MAEPTVVRRRVDTEEVLDALRTAAAALGVEAYLVGGFVRDRLLGRGISKDIDALVVGDGAVELLARVARGFGWSRPQQSRLLRIPGPRRLSRPCSRRPPHHRRRLQDG